MSDRKGNNSLQPSLGYADLLKEWVPDEILYRVRSPTNPNKLIYVSTVKSDIYSVVSPIKLSTIIQEEEKKVGFTLPAFALPSNYNNDDNNVTLYGRAEDNDKYSFCPIKPHDDFGDDFGGGGDYDEEEEESQTSAVGGLADEDISRVTSATLNASPEAFLKKSPKK